MFLCGGCQSCGSLQVSDLKDKILHQGAWGDAESRSRMADVFLEVGDSISVGLAISAILRESARQTLVDCSAFEHFILSVISASNKDEVIRSILAEIPEKRSDDAALICFLM